MSTATPRDRKPDGSLLSRADLLLSGDYDGGAVMGEIDEPTEEFPKFRIDLFERCRNKIMLAMSTVDGGVVDMIEAVDKALKFGPLWTEAAIMTSKDFLEDLDPVANRGKIATRLAGNHQTLLDGIALPKWRGKPSVWAAVRVKEARNQDNQCLGLKLSVVSGPAAGLTLDCKVGGGMASRLLEIAGMPKFKGPPRLWLTRFWFMAMLTLGSKGLSIGGMGSTCGMRSRNQALNKERLACPKYDRGISCELCPQGLDTCNKAVRPVHLTVNKCVKCLNEFTGEPGEKRCWRCAKGGKR